MELQKVMKEIIKYNFPTEPTLSPWSGILIVVRTLSCTLYVCGTCTRTCRMSMGSAYATGGGTADLLVKAIEEKCFARLRGFLRGAKAKFQEMFPCDKWPGPDEALAFARGRR